MGLGPRSGPESHSSLVPFLHRPYQWVLRYKARLQADPPLRTQGGNLLKGQLLHRLAEDLFDPGGGVAWKTCDQAALDAWIADQLPDLLRGEGAVFLQPGQQRERHDIERVAKRSLWELLRRLRAAKVDKIATETRLTGCFENGALDLAGIPDLTLEVPGQGGGILDLKWSGLPYRREELAGNRHLQLAIYAQLHSLGKAGPPPVGYYILTEARLLTQHPAPVFPGALACPPATPGEDLAQLWCAFLGAWRWRRGLLDSGHIELPLADTTPDARSVPPVGALALDEPAPDGSEFRLLTGWGDAA